MPVLVASPPPAIVVQAPVSATVTGVVRDAESGRAISGALVQQSGSVTSTFTGEDGRFRLLLDRRGAPSLQVTAVGYEAATVPVGQDLAIALQPVRGFLPVAPIGPTTPLGSSALDKKPLNSGVIFGYRLRHQTATSGAASISGFANNDFKLGARFRWSPWLVEGEGMHWETPIDVTGLPREENPAFSPSAWAFGARAGRIFPFGEHLEAAAMLGYRYQSVVPNNNDIPYTGSALDFEQTRHAFGPVGTVAWRPAAGPWHLEGSLGLYPLVVASARTPGTPYAGSFLTDLRGTLGYEIVPGMRAGLGYGFQDWRGNGADSAHLFQVLIHYTPGGVPASPAERAQEVTP